jgi:TRAP-type transport system small permease protein
MTPPSSPPNWPRPLRWLVKCEEIASVFFLAVIIIMITAQVAARYLFRSPITFSEELARFSLIWLAFISATFVLAHRRHLAVDLLSKYLQRRGRIFLECFSSAIILACSGLLLPSGLQFVQHMGRVKSAALQIPMSWWYLAALTGFALLASHSIINILLVLRSPETEAAARPDIPPEIRGAA